jgi:hypothetical protein
VESRFSKPDELAWLLNEIGFLLVKLNGQLVAEWPHLDGFLIEMGLTDRRGTNAVSP